MLTVYILQVSLDNFVRREVLAVPVHCIFLDDGCNWKGEVRELEVNIIFYVDHTVFLSSWLK